MGGTGVKNSRRKGLAGVREVKKILEANGSMVTGPGYQPVFAGGRMITVHRDYLGLFDLISMDGATGNLHGHQVTISPAHLAEKVKDLADAGAMGYVWVKYPKKKAGSRLTKGWRAWRVYHDGQAFEVEPGTV